MDRHVTWLRKKIIASVAKQSLLTLLLVGGIAFADSIR